MSRSIDDLAPIPSAFYSFETGAPFTHCIECDKHLMDGQPYLIEKAIKTTGNMACATR